MIKVALNGGLGNQLFQYAAGRALAEKHQTTLCFDLLPLYSKLQFQQLATYRRYELDVFCIQADKEEVLLRHKLLYPIVKSQYYLSRGLNHLRYHYFKEKDFAYDASLLQQPDNSYLDGHFQSEKYFKSIEPLIRKELQFKEALMGENLDWKQKIGSTNAVSLHIRRGDYAALKKNLSKHGLTSMDYYQRAIDYIAEKVSDPHFFIFTDDHDWVRAHFSMRFPHAVVDANTDPGTAYFDMHLMSLCKHHIICNSTFSWWGAWLNNKPGKLVVAPEQWFADRSINSGDIYPPEWIKL